MLPNDRKLLRFINHIPHSIIAKQATIVENHCEIILSTLLQEKRTSESEPKSDRAPAISGTDWKTA